MDAIGDNEMEILPVKNTADEEEHVEKERLIICLLMMICIL